MICRVHQGCRYVWTTLCQMNPSNVALGQKIAGYSGENHFYAAFVVHMILIIPDSLVCLASHHNLLKIKTLQQHTLWYISLFCCLAAHSGLHTGRKTDRQTDLQNKCSNPHYQGLTRELLHIRRKQR